jgi:hypothetical protein
MDLADRLDRSQAADYLGIARQTLATWAMLGRGPAYHKLGRKVVYLRRDLDDYIRSCRIDPLRPAGEAA